MANLQKFAWLSIAAAVVTIALKAGAYFLTGSVGLLSDAAESSVNLIAAIVALLALRLAAQPADDGHHFGHTKAEYFSAAIEGMMVFVAALVIIWTAINRLLHPAPIENVGFGLGISVIASVINGVVAIVLLRAGRDHRSATLVADGKHLLTDVWTSAGVLVGVGLVWLTKLWWLDPVVALLVGINIVWTGYQLVKQSGDGLLDAAMTPADNELLATTLEKFTVADQVAFHGLRTRVAGRHRFAEVHLLVPGEWSVKRGHDFCHEVERAAQEAIGDLTITCHLEPIEDPESYRDIPTAHFPVGMNPTEPVPLPEA